MNDIINLDYYRAEAGPYLSGPAQIFGPGEAEHMTIDEAKNILDEEECK